jgi:hypothetical protein
MSMYLAVNEELLRARRMSRNSGITLFVLMSPNTFYDYMQNRPPYECVYNPPGEVYTIQGYPVYRSNDVEGFMVCRGASLI